MCLLCCSRKRRHAVKTCGTCARMHDHDEQDETQDSVRDIGLETLFIPQMDDGNTKHDQIWSLRYPFTFMIYGQLNAQKHYWRLDSYHTAHGTTRHLLSQCMTKLLLSLWPPRTLQTWQRGRCGMSWCPCHASWLREKSYVAASQNTKSKQPGIAGNT